MASSYSTNLKLELMTTGEKEGSWGTITNQNLGTALEEAIANTATVTFASGPVTLTASNSPNTQDFRNLRLKLGGTSGGAQNLIVPDIEKSYIVDNGCADTITVKTSAGSGVAVPAGKTMWVYADATDVVDVTTHLSSLTLSTALAIADGGTGATTAAAARTNLGLVIGTDVQAYDADLGTLAGLSKTQGNVIYSNGSAWAALSAGANGYVLTSNGPGTNPTWNFFPTGSVTSVGGSGGTTGLTLTGGPITTAGTLTIGGTLAATNGGTGLTSLGTGIATWLGTPSSANLRSAVTDETGSGALYFQNGALGTPSSGNLTNCTGYSAANVSGLGSLATQNTISNSDWAVGGADLAVANGGTGASTLTGLLQGNGTGAITGGATINNTNWSGTALSAANGGTGDADATNFTGAAGTSIILPGGVKLIWGSKSITGTGTITYGDGGFSGNAWSFTATCVSNSTGTPATGTGSTSNVFNVSLTGTPGSASAPVVVHSEQGDPDTFQLSTVAKTVYWIAIGPA